MVGYADAWLKLEARPRNLILQAESAPPLIKASLSYGNYRQRRRLAVGHAKGEREQTTRAWDQDKKR
ncbi:MAG: hypothetical protein F6K63_13820 [Moorea sp. SIO1G6]|uniref:hypothetical protein n=1 Tax=Moorena sp. SIO1G6 TaxID=2607840 RepID=UPI0013C117B6|nr:hypothetical protein [Moorena sp. SIO1G6]NET65396.1 hypothetical protein [Moorena sp. SIO1G6]